MPPLEKRLARAELLRAQGRYTEAAALLRSTLRHASDPLAIADICNALAVTYKYTGRFDEAQVLYDRALAIIERVQGPDHVDVASIYHNLGGLAHARGALSDAERPARRAVDIRVRAVGAGHPDVAADKVRPGGHPRRPRPGRRGRAAHPGGPGGVRADR
ncbi:hypothetical protein Ais01nite_79650 [Asanoa ishikariensis]|uniref:tetratricopeptide repeat protein n=1 Tax=Asanoa ishikariensis TaxID=137265 RepID=UPI000B88CCD4|nr:tetratricopeptide repeat protein [Asanoa ishikariensis]GIF69930.1 hypothetical protein Ais01nite_79650 [Asanoa ishikariensis]